MITDVLIDPFRYVLGVGMGAGGGEGPPPSSTLTVDDVRDAARALVQMHPEIVRALLAEGVKADE